MTKLTLVAGACGRIHGRRVGLQASIEGHPSAAAEDIASNLPTLRVASKNDLRVRALLSICGHLLVSRHRAIVGRLTGEIRVERRVVEIFIPAACQTVAGRFHKHALASRIGLIVASCQKEMYIVAHSARIVFLLGVNEGCPA